MLLTGLLIFGAVGFGDCIFPQVQTSYGTLEGYSQKTANGKDAYIFKSVPFAAPPIGPLRWKKPQPPTSWDGIRLAHNYSAACMSNSSTTSSPQKWVDEDCLYQNIFVPAACTKTNPCPVVFYVHGGGINYDSAVMFNDTFLINNFDVILVISAFRLGYTALLTFDDDSVVPRNLAIYDIIESLEFVQREAANFGGDPKRVTLLGHSMGGALSFFLSMSKTINPDKKLFQRAIAMSGPLNYEEPRHLQDITRQFVYRAGCWKDEQLPGAGKAVEEAIECLRKKDQMQLLAIQRAMEDEEQTNSLQGIMLVPPLFPNTGIDDFLTNVPKIDVVMGSTLKEMDKFGSDMSPGEKLHFRNPVEVNKKYYGDRLRGELEFNHTTDTQILYVTNYHCANAIQKVGGKVYLYSFDYPKHPYHTDDLFYIMGIHRFEMDENEEVISEIYPLYFLDFARTGVPDKDWIPYDPRWQNYLSINVSLADGVYPRNMPGYQHNVIDYWTKYMKAYDGLVSFKKHYEKPEGNSLVVPSQEVTSESASSLGVTLSTLFLIGLALGIVGLMVKNRDLRMQPEDMGILSYK
ncbi:unnamed protein product, partial [Mesorhabditis spiculigera]